MTEKSDRTSSSIVQGYHPITRWLHAGLVLGVIFQLFAASMMAHPEHQHGGSSKDVVQASTKDNHHEEVHEEHHRPTSVEATHAEHKQDELGSSLMQAHRVVGLLVVVIVLLNLMWAVIRRGELKKRQMAVLFSKQHWCEALSIAKDVPLMFLGRKPLAKPGNSLSLIVEMLGLLTMTAMASTGFIIWNLWAGLGNKVSPLTELLMQVHGTFAVLLFVYLAGHVSMALLHTRAGDKVFARILPVGGEK